MSLIEGVQKAAQEHTVWNTSYEYGCNHKKCKSGTFCFHQHRKREKCWNLPKFKDFCPYWGRILSSADQLNRFRLEKRDAFSILFYYYYYFFQVRYETFNSWLQVNKYIFRCSQKEISVLIILHIYLWIINKVVD